MFICLSLRFTFYYDVFLRSVEADVETWRGKNEEEERSPVGENYITQEIQQAAKSYRNEQTYKVFIPISSSETSAPTFIYLPVFSLQN